MTNEFLYRVAVIGFGSLPVALVALILLL